MKLKTKLRGALFKSKRNLGKAAPTIMTVAAAAGVVATAVMAVKETPKALRLLEEKKAEKEEDLTILETVQTAWKCYLPAVGVGTATIAVIFGANVLNKKQQANLLAAYTAVDQSYRQYRKKVKDIFGEEDEAAIRKMVAEDEKKRPRAADDEVLFYDEWSNRYFSSTMERVLEAEYHFNRNFVLRGYSELNELYEFLGLPPTETGAMIGWSMGAGAELYGYQWIDFQHDLMQIDDGNGATMDCYFLRMPFEPTSDFMDY